MATIAEMADAPALAMVDAVARAAPAVVSVEGTKSLDTDGDASALAAEIFARRFCLPEHEMSPRAASRRQDRATGLILTEDGRIATSAEAVDGAQQVRVRLADGRTFDAQVVGVDSFTDIALLKVGATGFPTVSFA